MDIYVDRQRQVQVQEDRHAESQKRTEESKRKGLDRNYTDKVFTVHLVFLNRPGNANWVASQFLPFA